jgi:hypothetical protein
MSTANMDVKDDSPDMIGPDTTPKKSFADKGRALVKKFTTKSVSSLYSTPYSLD